MDESFASDFVDPAEGALEGIFEWVLRILPIAPGVRDREEQKRSKHQGSSDPQHLWYYAFHMPHLTRLLALIHPLAVLPSLAPASLFLHSESSS
jgi:hypothetical protein